MTRIQGDPNYSTWPFFGQKSQCFQRISLNNYLVFEFISTNLSRIIRNKNVFNAGDDHMHYFLKKIFEKDYLVITITNLIYLLNFLIGLLIFKVMGSVASIIFFIIFFFVYFYIREKIFRIFKL